MINDKLIPLESFFGFHASLNPEEVLELVLPDELAKHGEDFWGGPSPVLDVAIGEREIAALRMSAGRKVPPPRGLLGERPTPRRDTEV